MCWRFNKAKIPLNKLQKGLIDFIIQHDVCFAKIIKFQFLFKYNVCKTADTHLLSYNNHSILFYSSSVNSC